MTNALHLCFRRRLTIALAGALLLALAPNVVSRAQAASGFGGLGRLGESVISKGQEGKAGQVNPSSSHGFAVNDTTGEFFVADEYEASGHYYVHLQKFAKKGELLAENKIKVANEDTTSIAGVAVDPSYDGGARVYLLLAEERPVRPEKYELRLEKLEEKNIALKAKIAKAKEKDEPTTTLEAELKQVEKEEKEVELEGLTRNPEAPAASKLYAFSSAVVEKAGVKELSEEEEITGEETFKTQVPGVAPKEGKEPLLLPAGIAVDPTTHDVVIVARQNESESLEGPKYEEEEEEEEYERTVVQRVHSNGKLGPRYIDSESCLSEHEVARSECEDDEEEFGRSPIVAGSGKVFVQDGGEEIWEFPSTEKASGEFAEVPIQPRHLYTVEPEEYEPRPIVEGEDQEGQGGTMSFVTGGGPAEGTIYLAARIGTISGGGGGGKGVEVLSYAEKGGVASVAEGGWTAGQETLSSQQKCVIEGSSGEQRPEVAAAGGEEVIVLGFSSSSEKVQGGVPKVVEFGPGGEACGSQPTVTPPSVEVGSDKDDLEFEAGKTATLSSNVAGAHAKTVRWSIKYKNPEGGEPKEEVVESPYELQLVTELKHEFARAGTYEISETIATDNLSYPSATAETVKVTVRSTALSVQGIASSKSPVVGQPVTVEAEIKANELTPHVEYTWSYGEGSSESGTAEGKEHEANIDGKHTFTSPGMHEVVLEVKIGKESARKSLVLEVEESAAEKEAKAKKQAEEAQQKTQAEEAQQKKQGEEAQQKKQGEEAQQKKEAEEAQQRKQAEEAAKKGVLPHEERKYNPEAKLSSSSIAVSSSGALTIKVTCPSGETSCAGNVTLRTLKAVSAGAHKKKAILTLASGHFSVAGGHDETVTLHLSAVARKLLAHSHDVLRALATLVAHDAAGTVSKTVNSDVTLRLAKKH